MAKNRAHPRIKKKKRNGMKKAYYKRLFVIALVWGAIVWRLAIRPLSFIHLIYFHDN